LSKLRSEAIRRLLLEGAGERWDAVGEALLFMAARRDQPVVVPAKIASDVRSLLDKIKSRSGDKPATSAG
jgi:hypothetical protein